MTRPLTDAERRALMWLPGDGQQWRHVPPDLDEAVSELRWTHNYVVARTRNGQRIAALTPAGIARRKELEACEAAEEGR